MPTYTGHKIREYGWDVRKDSSPLTVHKSIKVWNHSPDGFSWGFGGSGPAQLALALLLDVGLSDEEAIELHQQFKREVVAKWDIEGDWTTTTEEIRQWIGNKWRTEFEMKER